MCRQSLLFLMPVRWIPGSGIAANSYLHGRVLVDAGVSPLQVRPFADQVEVIVLTHCHYDHTARLPEIRSMTEAEVCIHAADGPGLANDLLSAAMLFGERAPPAPAYRLLRDGDVVGDLKVIHTPGHTPGGICLYDEDSHDLISGDTVFSDGGFGRTDLPGGDEAALRASLERLAALEVRGLYPGHGPPVENGGSRHIAAARKFLSRFPG
jgi:glyoxylase-like metal-dependent hydrolase (beta-lactamase superfamily II)